ncbi:MAG TPA: hypothetical protein PKB01_08470, partial [Xanthobacteraceae bacterium]|nr:hypothetical protein [Xanthobacteraceae bacterium]
MNRSAFPGHACRGRRFALRDDCRRNLLIRQNESQISGFRRIEFAAAINGGSVTSHSAGPQKPK